MRSQGSLFFLGTGPYICDDTGLLLRGGRSQQICVIVIVYTSHLACYDSEYVCSVESQVSSHDYTYNWPCLVSYGQVTIAQTPHRSDNVF